MSKSEFGKGYVVCLWMFANHTAQLDKWHGHLKLRYGDEVHLWANGASDHLYGLHMRRPRKVPEEEYVRAKRLAVRWLDVGHGLNPPSATYDEAIEALKEATALVVLSCNREGKDYPTTAEEAIEIDKMLGIKRPDEGQWGCSENKAR
jgi:hypothetical protein